MIDVPRLMVLRAAAARGSLSAAARLLKITPSAVSQQVAALERQVGVPLVERRTTGITLTAPGRALVATAEVIAAELAKAERHIAEIAEGSRGRLTVATFASAGQRLLPQAVSALAADRPDAEVTVLEYEPFDAVPKLRRGEADLAIVYHFGAPKPPDDWGVGESLRYVRLRRDPVLAVLPADHPLASRRTVTFAELADERWVQGWADVGQLLDHYAAVAGFTPRVACYASDYLFMQSVVAAGMGVALVPSVALANPPDEVAARRLDPEPVRHVGALYPIGRWHSPLTEELLARLRATVAD